MNPLLEIEGQVLEEGREWTRLRLQERLRSEADAIGSICPHSGLQLKDVRQRTPPKPAPESEAPFSLVIMMDGWMVRERGVDWGAPAQSAAAERVSWREVKSAVIYRLDRRAQTETAGAS